MSVKWGVLGTAGIAKGCTIPGMKSAANCELFAIAGRNEEKVRSYKEEFGFAKSYIGYEALLEDPEVQAVYIPLPNHLHKEWVIKACRAGKHVLCEKPLALCAEDAREMYREAEANGVFLMEAYAYLHTPYIASLIEDVKGGVIGEPDYIETAFFTQGYVDDIRIRRETGGGAMYDLGCYCTTMILSLLDSPVELVMGNAEFNERGVDIFSSALLKLQNGARASFNAGMIFDPTCPARWDRLYIHGPKGIIRSDVEYNQAGDLSYSIIVDGQTTVRKVHNRQNYSLEVEQFGRCIEENEKPHITPEFSIRNAELMDTLLEKIGYTAAV